MAFNSRGLLDDWKASGRYPAIHDRMFAMVTKHVPVTERVVDVCCSLGLLTRRLRDAGYDCHGYDADKKAVRDGLAAGIGPYLRVCDLKRTTDFVDAVKARRASCLVARRCLSELYGHDGEAGLSHGTRSLLRLKAAGIRHVVLQGRVDFGDRAVTPLKSVEEEVALVRSAGFDLVEKKGQVAYLSC